MPTWLIGFIRTTLQAGWGYLAGWLIVHHIPVPADAPEWLQLAVLSGIAGLVAALIQWAERRGDSPVGKLVRWLARILMLGAPVAAYVKNAPASVPVGARPQLK